MTPSPNSPAMEALDYIAENFSEDVPDDVYEKADTCYETIRKHIAKLEAERDEALRNFMNATPFSKDEVAKMCSDYTSTIEEVTAERDALISAAPDSGMVAVNRQDFERALYVYAEAVQGRRPRLERKDNIAIIDRLSAALKDNNHAG